jgi:hypothetical protein
MFIKNLPFAVIAILLYLLTFQAQYTTFFKSVQERVCDASRFLLLLGQGGYHANIPPTFFLKTIDI